MIPDSRKRHKSRPVGLPTHYNIERYIFYVHRATGLYMLAYFFIHILVMNQRLDGEAWESIRLAFSNPTIYPVTFIFTAALMIHGLNGLRLIATELGYLLGEPKLPVYPYVPSSIGRTQKLILLILMCVAAALTGVALIEFIFFVG